MGKNWLEHALVPLQSGLMNCIMPLVSSGQYRGTNLRIRSVFGSALHELAIPSDTIPEAMAAFTRGFDGRLWGDTHPLVRAGMAHIELMAIHPFRDGNGRLGRLLLQAMLIERAVPGMPLEAIFTWNRDAYLERVDAAVRKADLLTFMQFLLKAVEKAVSLGRHFVPGLLDYKQTLFPALTAAGGRFAMVASEHAASMVLGPDDQFARRVLMDPNGLCQYLADGGLDFVVSGGFAVRGHLVRTAWSSPVARDLLIAPPARI